MQTKSRHTSETGLSRMLVRIKQEVSGRIAIADYIRQAHRLPVAIPTPEEFSGAKDLKYPLKLLTWAVRQRPRHGLIAEFGVYQGITLRRIAREVRPDKIYGFDSFEGIPEGWTELPAGTFQTAIPPIPSNAELVVGLFDETLRKWTQSQNDPISFIHIDCDLYSSTKTVLAELRPMLVKGSVILFNELHGWDGWHDDGEFKALQESGIKTEPIGVCLYGGAVAVKVV